jgi:preprotein translocase subunit SecY
MVVSETTNLLRQKIIKILSFLIVIRLALYIPIPGIDLDIFSQNQTTNSVLGIARNLTGSSFLGIGSLGILPYINSSIVIQLLTPLIPTLERLQKEEGELGQQQIRRYTRYLTFGWAIVLSTVAAFVIVKPIVFNWSLGVGLKIIAALTTGSMLSMWLAELITNEQLGNGSSMIIFINIIGSLPTNFTEFTKSVESNSGIMNILNLGLILIVYLLIVCIIILVQASYKKVAIVSARQLSVNYLAQGSQNSELKNSYIPIKLNPGGIMPLVFSTTITTLLLYPLQLFFTGVIPQAAGQLTSILTVT